MGLDSTYLRGLAVRCRSIANGCFDWRARDALHKLAQELTEKADSLDGHSGPSLDIAPDAEREPD
jgi:hypothetical protein